MARIVIKAKKYASTPESEEVFDQRGWTSIYDQTTIPEKRKLVNKGRRNTPLINLEYEEWEYGS